MNGFIKRAVAALSLGGLCALAGCCSDKHLCDCYDHCWPERYNFQARESVNATFGAQVSNGHVLDQTVWTYHFKAGTAELTRGGQEHLAYLARRRPAPDTQIYLQTAQDVLFDPANPEKLATERSKLNAERQQAVLAYLNAETAGRPVSFAVNVHDAPTPGYAAPPIGVALTKHYVNFQGVLPISTVGGTGSGGGTPR